MATDSNPPAKSILETLRTVEFRYGLKGYNVDEVDEYLEKAAVEAESLQEQVRQLNERYRQAAERLAQMEAAPADLEPRVAAPVAVEASDDALQRTLLLAQRFVDQAKRESESEAADVVARAEERARTMVAQAEEDARQIAGEAEIRLREEVTRLEAMRGQLAADVETMARHLESERNRIHGALSDVLKWVDENVQPASALMALRSADAAPADADRPRASTGSPAVAGGPAANGDTEVAVPALDLRDAEGLPSEQR